MIYAEYAGILVGLFVGLIALIYRNMDRRVRDCELNTERIVEIGANVKLIKEHCVYCNLDLDKRHGERRETVTRRVNGSNLQVE